MPLLLGLLVAAMLVLGQVAWKLGASRAYHGIIRVALSPYIISGLVIYGLATVLYIYILGRYPYAIVQSIILPASLIMAVVMARLIFNETLSAINVVGLAIIVAGIVMAVHR